MLPCIPLGKCPYELWLKKYTVNAAARCQRVGPWKHDSVYVLITVKSLRDFELFSKVKMTKEVNSLNWFSTSRQPHKATKNIHERGLQNSFRRWQEWWNKCIQAGSILRRVKSNISSTIMHFLNLYIPVLFDHTWCNHN